MIIFAKRLRERPTECTLDGIVRHPQTLSLYNQRKYSRPNSNIHSCGLTKKSKYEMHHKGKETEMLNANMFAFNHTSLHYILFADYQTIKQPKKMLASFERNQCKKKQKTLFN